MMICPDCHHVLEGNHSQCSACSWSCHDKHGIDIYLSSSDKDDSMFKRYLDNYHDISVDDLEDSIQPEIYLKSQNEKLFSYLPSLTGLSVCEVGIGKGILLDAMLKEKPAQLVGVDISIPYLKAIQKKYHDQIHLVVANAENLPFQEAFDVIVAADIIEHVFNVGDFLYSVNRALKPGGRFIVKTPNNEDITVYSKLKGCKYQFVHLRNFNKKTLEKILIGAGFNVEKVIYDGFYPHRKRDFIKNNNFLNKQFDKYIDKNFESPHHVNRIDNRLGNLLMEPIEMTLLARKSE